MGTIKSELESIAKVCATSEEFVGRANNYLRKEKGINQPLMDDSELRDIFRSVDYQRERDKAWEVYDNIINPSLKLRPECKGLWYEVWIDLSEDWIEKWFASFRFMEYKDIVEVCVKYLNERERFYGSSDYTDMLNGMLKECEFSK